MTFSTIQKPLGFLLRPVARALWWYIGLIAVRELVRIGGNYSMSATFRFLDFLEDHDSGWSWAAFLGALALYGEISVRINGAAFWQITARVNAPLFKHMRGSALRKFLALPVGWHQRHNSAALAGEVNNGIERAHEIFDAAAWQLLSLIVATLLSIVPLLWFSPRSALALAVSGGLSSG
jgi:ABC-type transport system involved in cytochrome bd biosynthesis fused ATPase/permease subunit